METERLRFRPFLLTDLLLYNALDSDPEVVRYLGTGKVKTPSESLLGLEKIVAVHEAHGLGVCVTELKSTGEFVGRTGLIPRTIDGDALWEVGYTFAKSFWGQGLATEAATFWKQYAFEKLPIDFVVSLIHPENKASMHVAEKHGMRFWKKTQFEGWDVTVFRAERSAT